MPSAAGLSATYGGYQQGRQADQKIESQDLQLEQQRIGHEADAAWGNTIPVLQQMLMPGASQMPQGGGAPPGAGPQPPSPGPQPPAPGQPSQPMQQGGQPQMLGGPAPPTGEAPPSVGDRFGGLPGGGAPPPPPAPASPPPQQMAQNNAPPQQSQGAPAPQSGQLNLHTVMAAVVKANPGAKPAVIAATVAKALPFMTAQAQIDYKQLMTQFAGVRAETGRQNADTNRDYKGVRAEQLDRAGDQRDRALSQGDQKIAEGARRTDYRMIRDALNRDERYQKAEAAKQTAIEKGDLAAARLAIDAAHKRALEYIQSGRSAIGTISEEDQKTIRAEADKHYNEEILKLRGRENNRPARPAGADTTGAPPGKQTSDRPPPSGPPGTQGAAPVAGAKKAPDGKWYVPDPNRQGKFLEVVQ